MILDMFNSHGWILLGLFLIIIETFIPGLGFLFAGLAATSTGLLVSFNIIDNDFYKEIACFLTLSVMYWAILWPILKGSVKKSINKTNNLEGQKVVIFGEDIKPNMIGRVKWSGTLFNAKLDENIEIKLRDTEGTIVRVEGNVLIIK